MFTTIYPLAIVYSEQGHYNDAKMLLRQLVQIDQKKFESDLIRTLNLTYELAYVYYLQT
jgi:hypothetical protein